MTVLIHRIPDGSYTFRESQFRDISRTLDQIGIFIQLKTIDAFRKDPLYQYRIFFFRKIRERFQGILRPVPVRDLS